MYVGRVGFLSVRRIGVPTLHRLCGGRDDKYAVGGSRWKRDSSE